MRADYHVYNEATGFVITSECRNGIKPEEVESNESKTWANAVIAGGFLPISLYQDDAFNVRVVLGDLEPEEETAWVDRFSARLTVADGRLVIVGGIEYMWEEELEEDYVAIIDVPPGDYCAEFYTFLHSVNGSACASAAGMTKGKLKKLFKTSRPGEEPPPWYRALYNDYDDFDEEEDDDEEGPTPPVLIDFLLRLFPWHDQSLPKLKLEDGWVDMVQSPRKLERAPDGIWSSFVHGVHDVEPQIQSDLIYRATIWPAIPNKLAKLEQPVDVAIQDLSVPYWIAWMCSQGCFASLRLDTMGRPFEPVWPTLKEGFFVEIQGSTIQIDLEANNSKWAQPERLRTLAQMLIDAPGSILTLATAQEEDEDEEVELSKAPGTLAFSGPLEQGVWRIQHTHPKMESEALSDLIEIAKQVDRKLPIQAADPDELDLLQREILAKDFLLRENPPEVDGLGLVSESFGALIACWLMRLRHPNFAPMEDLDDELDEWDGLMGKISRR